MLTAAFVLFFPVDAAIAMTAIVHFANNLIKFGLVGRHVRRDVVLRFGIPAILAALVGAWTLSFLADVRPLGAYEVAGRELAVQPLKLVIAGLMILFAMWEVVPQFRSITLGTKWLPLGGVLSGFFGGLSGNQGAFRSLFLLRAGLTKEGFIATGVAIALLIDASRLLIYTKRVLQINWAESGWLVVAAILAAGAGAVIGSRLMPTMTFESVRWITAGLLFIIAFALGTGVI